MRKRDYLLKEFNRIKCISEVFPIHIPNAFYDKWVYDIYVLPSVERVSINEVYLIGFILTYMYDDEGRVTHSRPIKLGRRRMKNFSEEECDYRFCKAFERARFLESREKEIYKYKN